VIDRVGGGFGDGARMARARGLIVEDVSAGGYAVRVDQATRVP
jgi:hypothetical protein